MTNTLEERIASERIRKSSLDRSAGKNSKKFAGKLRVLSAKLLFESGDYVHVVGRHPQVEHAVDLEQLD